MTDHSSADSFPPGIPHTTEILQYMKSKMREKIIVIDISLLMDLPVELPSDVDHFYCWHLADLFFSACVNYCGGASAVYLLTGGYSSTRIGTYLELWNRHLPKHVIILNESKYNPHIKLKSMWEMLAKDLGPEYGEHPMCGLNKIEYFAASHARVRAALREGVEHSYHCSAIGTGTMTEFVKEVLLKFLDVWQIHCLEGCKVRALHTWVPSTRLSVVDRTGMEVVFLRVEVNDSYQCDILLREFVSKYYITQPLIIAGQIRLDTKYLFSRALL